MLPSSPQLLPPLPLGKLNAAKPLKLKPPFPTLQKVIFHIVECCLRACLGKMVVRDKVGRKKSS